MTVQADFVISDMNGVYFFLPSVLGDTRRETQNSYGHRLTPHHALRILWWLSSQLISASQDPNWSDPNTQLYIPTVEPKLTSFQNLKILRQSLPGMTSSTNSIHSNNMSSPISCLGVYYDISFPRGCVSECTVWLQHLNQETWVVQSLTNLNNKIWLMITSII